MCGRYVNARADSDLVREFGVSVVVGQAPGPSWNIAPTQIARVVLERASDDELEDRSERILRNARWGLVPSWAKDIKIGNRLINARMETITERPAFRAAARRRRCLVPADGYYEWVKTNGVKVPYYLHRHCEVLAFAGLYELWPNPELAEDDPNRWLWTYTILTTTASDVLGHVHDRSPVVIPPERRAPWLEPELTDPSHVRALLAEVPPPRLEPDRVSTEVNDPRNNGPELVQPVAG
jgi:putative SOS response-associated peptidase YedK